MGDGKVTNQENLKKEMKKENLRCMVKEEVDDIIAKMKGVICKLRAEVRPKRERK